MSSALQIALLATGIAVVIVGVVTWMLMHPGRHRPRHARVQRARPAPRERIDLLLHRAEAGPPPPAPAVDLDLASLQRELDRHLEAGATERAVRVAQVMTVLGSPDPAVREVAERALVPLDRPQALSDERFFGEVASPALDPVLTGLSAVLGPEAVTWHTYAPRDFDLALPEPPDRPEPRHRLVTLVPPTVAALGALPVDVYLAPERACRLARMNLDQGGRHHAALAAGQAALALQQDAALRYLVAREITFARDELLICSLVEDAADLVALHRAAAHALDLSGSEALPAAVLGLSIEEALVRLRHALGVPTLRPLARRLVAAADEISEAAWGTWLEAARETASRAALLLGGSLLAAVALEAGPGGGAGPLPGRDRLLGFYLSDGFDRLRRDLGGGA
jgi:hypothetical protein